MIGNVSQLENTTKPIVISFESNFKENKNSKLFMQTLENHNWDYLFIGEGIKWEGFQTKIQNYHNHLQKIPENKIVILSDARDVFCTRSPESFINAIKNIIDIDSKILISAESFLLGFIDYTDEEYHALHNKNPNHFCQGIPLKKYWEHHNINPLPIRKYVNSGLITGTAKNLLKAFEWIIANNFKDDQHGFSHYTNEFPEKVYLDHSAEILHTSTFGVCGGFNSVKQKYDSPTFAEILGMSSYFLHIPGLNISKGQLCIYNFTADLIKQTTINKLADLYNLKISDEIDYKFFDKTPK